MALHLLKLIWNRKRSNLLIITEMLLSFIVLAAVTTVAVHYYRNYQAPLGFTYDRIWDVHVRVPRGIDSTPEADRERLARFVRLLQATRLVPRAGSFDDPVARSRHLSVLHGAAFGPVIGSRHGTSPMSTECPTAIPWALKNPSPVSRAYRKRAMGP